jgi:SAM-dependent methyltransferase
MDMALYSKKFFREVSKGSSNSAAKMVPFVVSLVQPSSVIDIACGTGEWIAAFMRYGVVDVLGIEGAHIEKSQLRIPASLISTMDIERPIKLSRMFDLAVSLETAEHLSPHRAASFVRDLTNLSPVVLFSAAIPGQGGANHVNEQWPTYWSELFSNNSFRLIDFRAQFWNEASIEWWYRQNVLLYAREDHFSRFAHACRPGPLDIIHPLYVGQPTVGTVLRSFPAALKRSITGRLFRSGNA